MPSYYTLCELNHGVWTPEWGSDDASEVTQELYYSPYEDATTTVIETAPDQASITRGVMELNTATRVKVRYMYDDEPCNDAAEWLSLRRFLEETEKLNDGTYPCDAWIKVLDTSDGIAVSPPANFLDNEGVRCECEDYPCCGH